MPPKKTPVKKPSRVTPAAPNKDTGEASLLGAQLDEDSWRSCVSLVVGNSPEDEELIQALASAVQQPQRKLFTLLTRNSILMKISELGNLKGKKVDDVSLFNEVLQSARVWLDAGEDIPFDLMAKILKLQLLQVKSSDQQRREAEQTEAEKAKGNPPPDSTDKAKGSDKRGKTPSKPVTSSMEKKTKLLRRGEVEPPTYIDDEPDWGPQHYVLLAGFYQPLLIAALDDIGVHVANVIKLCCDRTQIHRKEQQSCDDSEQSQAASAFSGAELAVQARRLDLFWSELRAVLDSGPPHSRLHDVVPLSYTVQDIHAQDPEDGLELGSRIFEGVANLIYDCLQWRRQHQHYLDSLQLLDVSGSGHKPAEVVISKEQLAVSNHSEEPEADENVWLDSQLKLLEEFEEEDAQRKTEAPLVIKHLDERALRLRDISRCRQRSLNDRCYTEHHSADVLQQVLLLASEEYRCLDAFRGTHTDTLYIFCHNPMNPDRQNQEFWDVALHTDVKFRSEKYLEHVADTITDWTREEESKKEVFRNKSFAETPEGTASQMFTSIPNQLFITHVLLQAWKAEQEQLQEEEMAKRLKTPKSKGKQQKEAQPSAEKGKDLSAGKKSRPNTAGSQREAPKEPYSHNRTKRGTVEGEDTLKNENMDDFQGYSMDGQLIHVSGHVQNLFPSDGGHITVENVNFVEGSRLMKVSVKKDGHHFYTHINRVVVQPVKPPEGQRDQTPTNLTETYKGKHAGQKLLKPKARKMVKQGSFTAELDNKIHISYSFYGPTGEYTGVPHAEVSCVVSPELGFYRFFYSRERSVCDGSFQGCEDQPDAPPPGPISGFNVSLPSGLLLQFQPEDTQGTILVRQSFPLHVRKGAQHLRDKSLSSERSRIITGQGDVVRFLKDGSTEVLCADGSVSVCHDAGPVSESDGVENPRKSETAAEAFKPCWQTTTPTGSRICTDGTTNISSTPLLTHKATDPITNQVMLSREDLVVSVGESGRISSCRACRRNQNHQLPTEPPTERPEARSEPFWTGVIRAAANMKRRL
ncbi:Sperm-associated antigen 17 [Oryzias melastigma]|uniref:Sperm-associated antigen 17 n=1 Tax=Oryzias melastigma TaxID=30732 RepID=A0A834FQ46_ORYME|nr:Sperm-associated antigen 17 [Oryzias melastigma]